jgi:hypothetical protein
MIYSPVEQNILKRQFVKQLSEEEIWEEVKKNSFPSRKDATMYLQFTLGEQQGKTYKIDNSCSGGRSLFLRCAGCQAFIQFTKRGNGKTKSYSYFSHSQHEDVCTTLFHPKPRHLSQVIDKRLFENCRNKTEAVVNQCTEKNWIVDKTVVENILFRGVSDQKSNEVIDDIERLEPFLLAFTKKNPECKYRLDAFLN